MNLLRTSICVVLCTVALALVSGAPAIAETKGEAEQVKAFALGTP